jgi:hypothetical protein
MIEVSGAGSVFLTDGSGSGRPKNIRIRIRNTYVRAGTTPERAEYEASVDLSAEEGMGGGGGGGAGGSAHLNIIDEDEWTDLNFGNNSTNCANTSDDSISDLDSDQG